MDLESITPLLTPAGWSLLAGLPPYSAADALALGTALREQGIPADLVSAALTQSRLRAKAQAKFGDLAADMLFTPAGLEQATRLSLAARHAHRFRTAGCTYVADLGCGIGADSMALAGMDLRVLAVEKDPTTALVAGVNLRPLPEARVVTGDALAVDLDGVDGVWADPARRRSDGSRVHRLADYSPDPAALFALRERIPALGAKLGPAIAHRDIPQGAHAQWVEVHGEVLEADLWFGPLAPEGPGRSALVIDSRGVAHVLRDTEPAAGSEAGGPTREAADPVTPTPVGPLRAYIHEVNGAVMRAGLVYRVAQQLQGHLIDPTIAVVTSDNPTLTPFATTFRVLDHLPFSLKRLRAYLRERRIGSVEIKKRGSAIEPSRLRGQLSLAGPNRATLLLTRLAGAQHVLVLERVSPPPEEE